MTVLGRPGPIVSRALRPPGATPVTSAFLSAAALDAAEEDRLEEILRASVSLDDFLARSRRAGYAVRRVC